MHKKKLISKFTALFGEEPVLFNAPGRINIIGEHTDYNDGFVLPAAIDKNIVVAIKKNKGSKCNLYSIDYNQSFEFDLNQLKKSTTVWSNYIIGVVNELIKSGNNLTGFNAVFEGNIPLGAGLSSSAALECVFSFALNSLNNLKLERKELAIICQKAENNFVGVKCGIMDQYASLFGKMNQAILLDCRNLTHEMIPLDLGEYQIILADSKVKHSLASSEYNTRRNECEKGVAILSSFYPQIKKLRDVDLSLLNKHKKDLPKLVYNRCRYVIEENSRILAAVKYLKNGDIKSLGKLLFETHIGLSNLFEVSCAELDFLVNSVMKMDAVAGARMMGGGFGGCTLNLVHNNYINEFKLLITKKYSMKFGFEPAIYIVNISDGCGIIDF